MNPLYFTNISVRPSIAGFAVIFAVIIAVTTELLMDKVVLSNSCAVKKTYLQWPPMHFVGNIVSRVQSSLEEHVTYILILKVLF